MDCGFSSHVGGGVNWCSPYKSWQKVYDNDLHQILERHGGTIEDRKRVTGAEVALWTETVSGGWSWSQKSTFNDVFSTPYSLLTFEFQSFEEATLHH